MQARNAPNLPSFKLSMPSRHEGHFLFFSMLSLFPCLSPNRWYSRAFSTYSITSPILRSLTSLTLSLNPFQNSESNDFQPRLPSAILSRSVSNSAVKSYCTYFSKNPTKNAVTNLPSSLGVNLFLSIVTYCLSCNTEIIVA